MRFVVVDRCPVPSKAAPFVLEAKRRSGQSLNSCFRGSEARALLRSLGKMDQATLYNGFLRHLPGFNPANPPGLSTHECFNDGAAFPALRRGARIPEELVGQDWTNAWKVVAAYRAMGVNAALTYPTSVREKQHINLRAIPRKVKPPLKHRSKDKKRVRQMTNRLAYIVVPNSKPHRHYLPKMQDKFDMNVVGAVQRFQKDHGLTPDGVFGELTEHQLDVATDYWHKRNAKKKPPKKPTPPKDSRTRLTGVDVSSFQGDIDWTKAKKAGCEFAFVKATEGIDWEDPRLTSARVAAMRKAGVTIGFYHFARPQPGRSAKAEAQHFIRVVRAVGGLKKGDLPPVLDIEWSQGMGQAQLRSWVRTFNGEVKRLVGARPIVYTGLWFWSPRLGNPKTVFGRCPLWIAAYAKSPTPYIPAAWAKVGWTFWQHSDKGRVPGISGTCDVNLFNGSLNDLKRLTLQ